MNHGPIHCVLFGDRHHGITEGIRDRLETTFSAVVMVADGTSLIAVELDQTKNKQQTK